MTRLRDTVTLVALVVLGIAGSGPVAAAADDPRARVEDAALPNVILVVVDTLRADRLSAYGGAAGLSPQIDRTLVRPGVVVDRAYAAAPWTLPSMMGLFTGRDPGRLVAPSLGSFRIPDAVPTLAEQLSARGLRTAAFVANPTLAADLGFHRGFGEVWLPEAKLESLALHATDSVQPRALAWLRQHARERFFLYVHYLDPHDPYESPPPPVGLPSLAIGLPGSLSGRDVHGLYEGVLQLRDPVADLRRLGALYDDEVRFVDRCVGELLDAVPADVMRRTLVVLTADHGEELFDHGGWKHGQTLYDEQVRVPLLARWDGRLPAGTRSRRTTSLVDLAPTVLSAAGGGPVAGTDGVSLLGDWSGAGATPAGAVFAQNLSPGPVRAAIVSGSPGRKLILFDRQDERQPADELQAGLATRDRARLRRVELYDLEADPLEHRDLAADRPAEVAALAPEILARLDRHWPGLRVAVAGLRPGQRARARLELQGTPREVRPLFLDAGDHVEARGGQIDLDIQGDPVEKGLVVDPGPHLLGLERAELVVDGGPAAVDAIRIGHGSRLPVDGAGRDALRGQPVASDRAASSPTLLVWWPEPAGPEASATTAPGQAERLRALGYLR